MKKTYFHNHKSFKKNKDKIKITQSFKMDTKSVVDINILLNRVKIAEKNETKRKIIFFSLVTFVLSLFITFITL